MQHQLSQVADQSDPAGLVELSRYPIQSLDDPKTQLLLAEARAQLAAIGSAGLPGFLRPEAVARLAGEATALLAHTFDVESAHTAYFSPPDQAVAADHPRRALVQSLKGGISYDHIPKTSAINALYRWDALRGFVSALLGGITLYRHADPLAALNINVFRPGQELGWHFDRADFVVSLVLQDPDAGGLFECVPWLRSGADENYPGVAQVIAGDRTGVRNIDLRAGTLAIFRGRHSLHRVTPVEGATPRLVAILSYTTEPDQQFQPWEREQFYGHAEPADA